MICYDVIYIYNMDRYACVCIYVCICIDMYMDIFALHVPMTADPQKRRRQRCAELLYCCACGSEWGCNVQLPDSS